MGKSKSDWALVLAGGGARGIAHIGVLKELADAGFPKPSLVVGTSMGAIVGGLYACGMSPAELENFVLNEFNITNYLDSFVFKLDGPVGKVMQTGQALANLAVKPGIDPAHRLMKLFESLTGGKNFDETEIPFRCNALDLFTGQEVIFSTGSVAKAIRASMSFPVFFEPVMEDGKYLVDGGLADNMPVAIARKEGYNRVIAVNVNRFSILQPDDLKNGLQIFYRSVESMLHVMEEEKCKADLTLDASDDSSLISFFRQKELVSLGKQTVKDKMKDLEAFFTPNSRFLA